MCKLYKFYFPLIVLISLVGCGDGSGNENNNSLSSMSGTWEYVSDNCLEKGVTYRKSTISFSGDRGVETFVGANCVVEDGFDVKTKSSNIITSNTIRSCSVDDCVLESKNGQAIQCVAGPLEIEDGQIFDFTKNIKAKVDKRLEGDKLVVELTVFKAENNNSIDGTCSAQYKKSN